MFSSPVNQFLRNLLYIAVLATILFASLFRHHTIADADGFYHAKISEVYAKGQWIDSLDSLPLTILGKSYTDHHFLYHILSVPFVWLFDPLIAVKILGVILAVSVLITWYLVAHRLVIKGAFWWTLINFTSIFFLYRMAMVKAVPLALIILLFSLPALKNYRLKTIFLLSFVFVWTYGGWPLLPIISILYVMVHVFDLNKIRAAGGTALASCLGALSGLIINPFFPQNLIFYKAQTIDIALFSTGDLVRGQEWLPVELSTLFLSLLPVWSVAFFILVGFIIFWTTQNNRVGRINNLSFGLFLFILSFTFFVLTVLSRRYIEFFSPLFILTVAWWTTEYFKIRPDISELFVNLLLRFRIWFSLLVFSLLLILIPLFLRLDVEMREAIPFTTYERVSRWLRMNHDSETLVFNVSWSDYPMLFYHNANTKFIFGLDPRLASDYKYVDSWYSIFIMEAIDPRETVSGIFETDLVLVNLKQPAWLQYFKKHEYVVVYQDEEAALLEPSK